MTKRILVCGGRDFNNKILLHDVLDHICLDRGWVLQPDDYGNYLPDVVIIEGGAKGADRLAFDWAITNWCTVQTYKADWEAHKKAAGPIRNEKMLKEGKPDLVVAFPTEKSKGTWHMVDIAKKAGVEVIVVPI